MIRIQPLAQSSVLVALLSGAIVSWGIAEEKSQITGNPESPVVAADSSAAKQMAFLGIVVEPIHASVVIHLKSAATSEQGVIVTMVGADSPADHAGVKVHDIVLAYDDQKLFTPEQLARLVASDRPGREVKLSLIHEGRPETAMVKLGERPVGAMDVRSENAAGSSTRSGRPRMIRRNELSFHALRWNEFDSISIKRLDHDRFQVNLSYPDRAGKMQNYEFRGTRDEIRTHIESDQQLSSHDRAHLLSGLGMHARRAHSPDDHRSE